MKVGTVQLKERKQYTFDSFKGVDFSTSPFKVAGNRATKATNLIYKDGTVRKRNGWESLCKLPARIDGLFSFEIAETPIVLAYAGGAFYRLIWDAVRKRYTAWNISEGLTLNGIHPIARRISVYVNDNKAYIVGCGEYLVLKADGGNVSLGSVYNDCDTYIPTTTISIDNDSVSDKNRKVLDSVNMLSPYRHNELVGVDANSAVWTLDASIYADTQVDIVLYTLDSSNNSVMVEIDNVYGESIESNLYEVKYNADTGERIYGDPIGTLDFAKGKITLVRNTKPQEENSGNIIVTFRHEVAGQADAINGATLSTIFGGGGNSNRLFLSGAKDRPHRHIWSEQYDYSYFPDNNWDLLGSDSSAIMGYTRVSDGTLVAFKEKNGSDATAYYITGTDTEIIDARGDKVFQTTLYKKSGNIADTVYAKWGKASLNGDNLIVTRNGVKGLSLTESISTESYKVQERSRNIDSKLTAQSGLAEAFGFIYKDKYYLAVDGVVYIADSRFPFTSDEDINGGFNYEWWYWDNVDASVFAEIDGDLYFGTNNGLICRFHNDYADMTYQDTETGDISVDYGTNAVTFNVELDGELHENDNIRFVEGDIYALHLDTTEIESVDDEGYMHFAESNLNKVYEGIKVYADTVDGTGLALNTEYVFGHIDFDNLRVQLLNNGVPAVLTATGFRLFKKVSGVDKTLYITEIDRENKQFKVREYPQGEILDLAIYNFTAPTNILATIVYFNNIRAEWRTPIVDLGTNMYAKTLLGLTVATEPLVKSSLLVGYQTINIERDFTAKGGSGFAFDELNFEDFSFEGSFANSHTMTLRERNFNFIVFRYISDNKSACAVNSISIKYKVNSANRGVR